MGHADETTAELTDFRSSLHQCLSPWGDALFELCDAALCSPAPVGSVPSLSLEPEFRRSHGSLYKSLAEGDLDDVRLRQLPVEHRPRDWPLVFAVDASTWDCCEAECSPERGFHYSASKHSAGQPIVAGWSYQWICQLNWTPDSWTAPLDALHITPSMDGVSATIDQVKRLVGLLPSDGDVPLLVFNAGYDGMALGHELRDRRAEVLVRIASIRVFHPDPEPRRDGTMGRPRRHGPHFMLADEATWTTPDAEFTIRARRYGNVTASAWHKLHPKLCRPGALAGLQGATDHQRQRDPGRGRTPAQADGTCQEDAVAVVVRRRRTRPRPVLARLPPQVRHQTHVRFVKGTLGWTTPSLRMPDQADCWTWLILAAYTQLRLARRLVDDLRLPWEPRCDPKKLTQLESDEGFGDCV
jgi:hypothetical protein